MSGDVQIRRWGVAENRTIGEKKIRIALLDYRDFMQGFLYQILRGGAIKSRTNGPVMFASLQSNVISFLCSMDLLLG